MLTRACLSILLLTPTFLWSQVDSDGGENNANPADEARMLVPPPVSGEAYPTAVDSEARSNYLLAGLIFNTAYTDNVVGGASTNPVSDISYSIWPTIALEQTSSRLHSMLTYSPGFTFYQRTA